MLKDTTVLITGCAGGIGIKILEIFSKNNANIIACVRNKSDEFEKLCEKLKSKYNNSIAIYSFDLLDEINLSKNLNTILDSHSKIDVLVNSAGDVTNELYLMMSEEKLREIFEVNFFAQSKIIKKVLKKMIANKSGSIINLASSSVFEANIGKSAYASSKAAMISLTEVISREVGRSNVRINVVSPGLTDTKMLKRSSSEEILNQKVKQISLKRIANPEEIANVILFLASNLSSYITGQVIKVDGGL
jgi:3-oxoacyl-[acyl-carrier protein] reductase